MQPVEDFKIHAKAFEKLLEQVQVDDISNNVYCKKYLSYILQHKRYYLLIYADVLHKVLLHSAKKMNEIVLVDFGAGNGLLGIFAKYCGFKKVLLTDMDAAFVEASRKLATQLSIEPEAFITGSEESLKEYCTNEIPDAILGTDVIEHIYNLEQFFSILKKINPSLVSVFTTASNPVNYFKVRQLKKMQIRDELHGGDPADHVLFGEIPHEPFLKIREQIVRKTFPQLSNSAIIELAEKTRGLKESDIINAVGKYFDEKIIPHPAAGTNTCNPINGSWTERLLSLDTYNSLYSNAGFTCRFYAGFYNEYGTGAGYFVKKLLNSLIGVFGKKISPYIVIAAFKN